MNESLNNLNSTIHDYSSSSMLGVSDIFVNTQSFFDEIYISISKFSKGKVDMYSINQLTDFPLLICDKLVLSLSKKRKKLLTHNEFSKGFTLLYFGSLQDKADIIFKLCDFNNEGKIWICNVKLLLLHFHMRLLSSHKEDYVHTLLEKYFKGNHYVSYETFTDYSTLSNNEVLYIFLEFFKKFHFFSEEQLKYYDELEIKHEKIALKECAGVRSKTPNKNTMISFKLLNHKYDKKPYILKKRNCGITVLPCSYFKPIENGNTYKKTEIGKSTLLVNKYKKSNYCSNISAVNESIIEETSRPNNILKMSIMDDKFCYKSNISNNVLEYSMEISHKNIKQIPFDKDGDEMRECLGSFSKDLSDILCDYRKQSDAKVDDIKKHYGCDESFSSSDNKDEDLCNQKDDIYNFLRKRNIWHNEISQKLNLLIPESNFISKATNDIVETMKEFIFYKKSSKDDKNLRMVKFVIINNMIFYFTRDNHLKEFVYHKLIIIAQLYSKIKDSDEEINKCIRKKVNEGKDYNTPIYCLELYCSFHNNRFDTVLYSNNIDDLEFLNAYLKRYCQDKEIDDVYIPGESLGSGNFGTIIKATHKLTKEEVSVKIISKQNEDNPDENFKCTQWEKDVFIFLRNLHDKHIIKCYEYFETPDFIYFVYELIKGYDIQKLVHNIQKKEISPLKMEVKENITKQIIKGISTLHRYGIIHRDIKHSNIMVEHPESSNPTVKIIDFGLSKIMGYKDKTDDKYGTLIFKAPELLYDNSYSFGVDVWALGITLFYFSTNGFYPFPIESKKNIIEGKLNYNIDIKKLINGNEKDFINKVIIKCLTIDYQKRPTICCLRNDKNKND